jgi:1,6-anhydro-N-acetylmuramate kinase
MAAPSSPAAPIPAIGLMSGTSQDRVDVARLAEDMLPLWLP